MKNIYVGGARKLKIHSVTMLVVIAFFVMFYRVFVVFAAQLIVIVNGARDVTIGSDFVDFGSFPISLSGQTVSGVTFGTEGIKVNDTVSGAAAWSVTLSVNNFTNGIDNIPYSNLEIKGDTDGVIGVVSGNPDTTGITTFSNYTAFSGAGANSNAITLVSADSRDRSAVYQTIPEMKLTVPPDLLLGTFTNTFTFTFIVN